MTHTGHARSLVLGLAALAAAGCSQVPPAVTAYHDAALSVLTDSAPREVGAAMALARLPEAAGQVIRVTQSRSGGVERQRITLAGDPATSGENAIEIRLTRRGTGPAPSAAVIRSEMATAFPGRSLGLSNRLPVNAYGPFGVASDGRGCAYLWQDVQRATGDSGLFRARSHDMAEIRVRLCRAGLTETAAVDLMQRLQLAIPGISSANLLSSLAAPGQPLAPALARVDTLLGAPGMRPDIRPEPHMESRMEPALAPAPTASRPVPPVVRPAGAAAPKVVAPAATAVAIPLPDPVTTPSPGQTAPLRTTPTVPLPHAVAQPAAAAAAAPVRVPLPSATAGGGQAGDGQATGGKGSVGPAAAVAPTLAQAAPGMVVRPIPLP
ncbi:cellulose biosynthesis protein BcsN [Pannonibacter tanglangensis]|uniref:Cellulose biosynthesis protein BcsN n=1 Tax=Pannonibacter tanglangensis TaxID=2750084 RepID=A0ABW9ZMX4_9HYPH|nr:cellulose biosynthesis protein BcsN [Pannonibacter sp. XCT-34]NBN64941.1 cellulose biosynthesis protein BcsN [Pannonibacter sp. XCT-34]